MTPIKLTNEQKIALGHEPGPDDLSALRFDVFTETKVERPIRAMLTHLSPRPTLPEPYHALKCVIASDNFENLTVPDAEPILFEKEDVQMGPVENQLTGSSQLIPIRTPAIWVILYPGTVGGYVFPDLLKYKYEVLAGGKPGSIKRYDESDYFIRFSLGPRPSARHELVLTWRLATQDFPCLPKDTGGE